MNTPIQKDTHDLRVIDVIQHQNGETVDLYLEMPKGFSFKASDGIGIAASMTDAQLSRIGQLLARTDDINLLVPQRGYTGPNYASPSDSFLDCLYHKALQKLKSSPDFPLRDELEHRTACLYQISSDTNLKNRLQANYSVPDMLELFPSILDADDITQHQPKEHGNKTYTVDGRKHIEKKNTKCFRLNITKDDGHSYRALFGETDPIGTKPGQTSTYLRNLQAGDQLIVNSNIKSGPQIPSMQCTDRPVLLVTQGNALIRMLSVLEDIKSRREQGSLLGPVILVSAFKTHSDVLEIEEIRPYLDDGTLSELHLCLSREQTDYDYNHDLITVHKGKHIQDIHLGAPFPYLERPFILLAGGQNFYRGENSVGKFLSDHYGYDFDDITSDRKNHGDMRISSSSDRKLQIQGEPYKSIDVSAALGLFRQNEITAVPKRQEPAVKLG